jgi:hypothetical protein
MSDFKIKYLKYKSKYLQLKNIKYNQSGGDLPIIVDVQDINLFTDLDMEKYMNPIHGLVLCNTGYIPNIYWLNKSNFINQKLMPYLSEQSLADLTNKGELINKVCKDIPGNIQPTNKLMDFKPIDYGRYIAIKYFNNKHQFISINSVKNKIIIDQKLIKEENIRKILIYDIDKIKTLIPILDNDLFTFHIILYCLCWVANNDNGITEYYQGINEVFNLLSGIIDIPSLVLQRQEKTNSFEEIVVKNTQQEFKIYNQEWAQNFCIKSQPKYPDCGETTALNLINLLIFNGSVFDISLLPSSSLPELVEFYRVFTNFNLISNINYTPEIFCQELNARDAWSFLIIKYAYKNLSLIKTCLNGNQKYELNAGLSLDNKTTNFLQLIKNLLEINKWEDLLNDNITNIKDYTQNGIGDIFIYHKKQIEHFIIHCRPGHYYMSNTYSKVNILDLKHLTSQQQNIINIIKKNIKPTIENYLDINLSSELLQQTFDDRSSSVELKKKLFVLSLTGKYDNDLRRRIKIDDRIIDDLIVDKLSYNKNLEEYTYQSNDFKFIERMPNLKHLNSEIKDKTINEIDLQPLSNLESIGNNFLSNCIGLTDIDLRPLSNLKSIGNGFLNNCSALTSIKLSNLESIGNNFLSNCIGLTDIDLRPLSKVHSIGDEFISSCSALTSIDLSPLSNLHSIGNYFLSGCEGLENIVLRPLSNLELSSLSNLELSSLSKLHSIGDYFLSSCKGLTSIDLSPLSNLHSIGNDFLSSCEGLTSIDLSSLSKVESIGKKFLDSCSALTSIDLSSLSNLKSIGNDFLSGCCKLTNIDLSSLSNLKSIGLGVLSKCSWVIKIICNTIIYNLLIIKNERYKDINRYIINMDTEIGKQIYNLKFNNSK